MKSEPVKFYQYEKCSTCRKAKAWLEENGVAFESIPIVEAPPARAELKSLIERSGVDSKKFFNTSGVSYREGKVGERLPVLSLDQRVALLAADGKLIRRPVLVSKSAVLVGFDEDAYRKNLL